jgi:hypothetical protein
LENSTINQQSKITHGLTNGQAGNHQSTIHWPSVLQLGFSLLGISTLWGLSFVIVVAGIVQLLTPNEKPASRVPFLLLAATGIVIGLILVPSAVYALMRLLGRQPTRLLPVPQWLRPTLLIFILPLVLLGGWWVSQQGALGDLALPIFHILAIGIPVLWLSYLAVRELPLGSPQRAWGALGSGSVLAPFLIMLVELGVLLGGALVISVWISGSPDVLGEMTNLAQRLEQAQQVGSSPEIMVDVLAPYLSDERVIFAAFAFGAVIVPLIEEALKPLGVWFLAGSRLTPAEGFAAGALCGAGYALLESLLLSSNGGTEWVSLAFARIGTGVIHILTSGLTGWALASAWAEGRYLRLGAAYLGAVLIHGLWNGLTILMVVAGLSQALGQPVDLPLAQMGEWAPYGLVALAVLGLAALMWANWRLRGGLKAVGDIV